MIQILAKHPALYAILQVLVGRGDDAHVHSDRRLAADAIELALGQYPQQTGLQRRRHIPDLIQEQRAAIRLLEATAAQAVRAGEGALLVTEELRLQQFAGNGRGVERDEGLAGTRGMLVQGAGDQFLAGTGFTRDQHRHTGAGQTADGAKHLLHGRSATQQFRNRRGARAVGGDRCPRARGAAHQVHGLVDVKGLGQVLESTALVSGNGVAKVRVRRHHDDRQRGPRLADAL